jgi:hypothetical protein
MAGLRQLICRHRFEPVEQIQNAGGDARLQVSVLRCSRCGKERIVAEGDRIPVGQGDMRPGSVRPPG